VSEAHGGTRLDLPDPFSGDEVATTPGGPLARFALFYRQVVGELRKVVYPSRDQLLRYTGIVLVFVLVMIAIVSLLDYGLSALVVRIFG
jgi:preprotein translocase subunit SecE